MFKGANRLKNEVLGKILPPGGKMRAGGMTSLVRRASILAMKILRSELPGYIASFCIVSAATLGGCASDDGAADTGDGDGDMPSGGSASGGGTASGGTDGSGGSVGTGGTSSEGQFPTDTTVAGIQAFLATESYKSWTADPAPHAPVSYQVHGPMMQVYFNDVAVATYGNASDLTMTVKELFDANQVKVGVAASWKSGGMWSYYCTQDDPAGDACAVDDQTFPVYGTGINVSCGFCHGNAILSALP